MWPRSPMLTSSAPQFCASCCAAVKLQNGSFVEATNVALKGNLFSTGLLQLCSCGGKFACMRVWRRDQERASHLADVGRQSSPAGHQMATQAVRHKAMRTSGCFLELVLNDIFQPRDPVAAQRVHPIVLLHPLVAKQRRPSGFASAAPRCPASRAA